MNPAGESFTLSWMEQCRESLVELTARATQRGTLDALAQFLVEIEIELRIRPREWGDPVWNWHGMRLVEYARVSFPDRLTVSYLVHETAPVVFVRRLGSLDET
jgi:hypothetical protein